MTASTIAVIALNVAMLVFVVLPRHCRQQREKRDLLRSYHRFMRKRMRDRLAKP